MMQHLFFDCQFARMVWTTVYAAWGIPKPYNMQRMFGDGSMEFIKNISHQYFKARQSCVGLFGYTEMLWCSITKNLPFCRLSTQLRTGSVHGLSFRSILCRTSLQRPLISWHRWPRIFFARAHGWRSSLRIDSHQCGRIFIKLFLGCVSFRQRSGKFQDDVSP